MIRVLINRARLALAITLAHAGSTSAQTIPEVTIMAAPRPKPAENVPPPPLGIFVKPPRVENIALSADGSRIAFVTHTDGLHVLAIYNTVTKSQQAVRLGNAPLSAISWLDNDHIMLSDTLTGIRGTCPDGQNQRLKDDALQMNLHARIDPDTPSTPGCVQYGVRSQDAVTMVDLRTGSGTTIGNKMSEFNNLALWPPKAVRIDNKMQLIGAFLELRTSSVIGQPTQRVYLWRTDPDTGIGPLVDDGGGDLDRDNRYVDDWLVDNAGQPIARALYSFRNETFSIEIRKDDKWTPVLMRKITGHEPTFAPFLAGLGRDGASLLILDIASPEAEAPRRFHYYELSADGKISDALEPDDATRDRPIFHPETAALAGFERDGETPTYIFFDPDLARYYQLAVDTAPGQAIRVAAMAQDPRQMILFAQGGRRCRLLALLWPCHRQPRRYRS